MERTWKYDRLQRLCLSHLERASAWGQNLGFLECAIATDRIDLCYPGQWWLSVPGCPRDGSWQTCRPSTRSRLHPTTSYWHLFLGSQPCWPGLPHNSWKKLGRPSCSGFPYVFLGTNTMPFSKRWKCLSPNSVPDSHDQNPRKLHPSLAKMYPSPCMKKGGLS